MTIFGISLGTSRAGVCILKDGELHERQVIEYNGAWSNRKLRLIIKDYRHYILKYDVNAMVAKVPPFPTPGLKVVLSRLEKLARAYHVKFDLTSIKEIKYYTGKRSTGELFTFARQLYPGLSLLYEKGKLNSYSYNKKLFEAVLSAHVFQEKQHARDIDLMNSLE